VVVIHHVVVHVVVVVVVIEYVIFLCLLFVNKRMWTKNVDRLTEVFCIVFLTVSVTMSGCFVCFICVSLLDGMTCELM